MFPMLGNALRMMSGPLGDLSQKLTGSDGLTVWLPALKRFLRKENPWDGKPLFSVVATVTIGQHRSVDELLETLKNEDILVRKRAEQLIRHPDFALASEPEELDLCVIQFGKHLDLNDGAPYLVAYRRVEMLGLQLCPPEAAIELRRLWRDQDHDDSGLSVAMKPIPFEDEKGFLDLGCNEDGQLTLTAFELNENYPGPTVELLCVLPRS